MCILELISSGYELTKYLINRFVSQECGDFTWRVSDCEELSGGLLTGDDGYLEKNYWE